MKIAGDQLIGQWDVLERVRFRYKQLGCCIVHSWPEYREENRKMDQKWFFHRFLNIFILLHASICLKFCQHPKLAGEMTWSHDGPVNMILCVFIKNGSCCFQCPSIFFFDVLYAPYRRDTHFVQGSGEVVRIFLITSGPDDVTSKRYACTSHHMLQPSENSNQSYRALLVKHAALWPCLQPGFIKENFHWRLRNQIRYSMSTSWNVE